MILRGMYFNVVFLFDFSPKDRDLRKGEILIKQHLILVAKNMIVDTVW